jgi:hypothetical protein
MQLIFYSLRNALLVSVALSFTPKISAQELKPVETIVVEGQRTTLTTMLRNVIAEAHTGQIGRFETKLCPRVIGLPADWTAYTEQMVRRNAEVAGLSMQTVDCHPNALVIFIDEPQRLVSELSKFEGGFFGHLDLHDKNRLIGKARPVYSWRVIDIKDRDGLDLGVVKGIPVATSSNPGSTGGMPTSFMPVNARIVRNARASHVGENTRQDILLSFAVIDKASAEGKTLRQLADIATLHLLLDIKMDSEAQAAKDSILSLFVPRSEGSAVPDRMSVVDKAMLAGLYKIKDNALNARDQRSKIASQIRKAAGEK